MLQCPNCKCKDIGKIGTAQYYCWGCFIEFSLSNERMDIFQVEEDGTLSSLNDLFYEDEEMEVQL
jgi:hypothetical protein